MSPGALDLDSTRRGSAGSISSKERRLPTSAATEVEEFSAGGMGAFCDGACVAGGALCESASGEVAPPTANASHADAKMDMIRFISLLPLDGDTSESDACRTIALVRGGGWEDNPAEV